MLCTKLDARREKILLCTKLARSAEKILLCTKLDARRKNLLCLTISCTGGRETHGTTDLDRRIERGGRRGGGGEGERDKIKI